MSFFTIIQLIYFMLPAYLANIAAEQAGKIFFKRWNAPIDGKLFGSHKKYRGVFFAIVAALIAAFVQSRIKSGLNLYDYSNWSLFGFLMGSGAMAGDIAKSFFKRRMGIKPGKPWIFDSIDFVIGALAFASFAYFPGWQYAISIVFISFPLSVGVNYLGYKLGLKEVKW